MGLYNILLHIVKCYLKYLFKVTCAQLLKISELMNVTVSQHKNIFHNDFTHVSKNSLLALPIMVAIRIKKIEYL